VPLSRDGGHGTSPFSSLEYDEPRESFWGAAVSLDVASAAAADRLPFGFPPRLAFVSGPASSAFRHCSTSVRWSAAYRYIA